MRPPKPNGQNTTGNRMIRLQKHLEAPFFVWVQMYLPFTWLHPSNWPPTAPSGLMSRKHRAKRRGPSVALEEVTPFGRPFGRPFGYSKKDSSSSMSNASWIHSFFFRGFWDFVVSANSANGLYFTSLSDGGSNEDASWQASIHRTQPTLPAQLDTHHLQVKLIAFSVCRILQAKESQRKKRKPARTCHVKG